MRTWKRRYHHHKYYGSKSGKKAQTLVWMNFKRHGNYIYCSTKFNIYEVFERGKHWNTCTLPNHTYLFNEMESIYIYLMNGRRYQHVDRIYANLMVWKVRYLVFKRDTWLVYSVFSFLFFLFFCLLVKCNSRDIVPCGAVSYYPKNKTTFSLYFFKYFLPPFFHSIFHGSHLILISSLSRL